MKKIKQNGKLNARHNDGCGYRPKELTRSKHIGSLLNILEYFTSKKPWFEAKVFLNVPALTS